MPDARPLLMIPGPIELSPAVRERSALPPPGHLAPHLIEAFGSALEGMRKVWCAPPAAQPFVVAGGGTLAMDMAVSNLIEPGERVVLINTGYFSDRLAGMLRRLGAEVTELEAPVGEVPALEEVREALDRGPAKLLCATHVDTSTGVRVDPAPLAALARERDVLSVFDGVCATAGERFDMAALGADVYLTASQKAIGLPPGLALSVVSERALAARAARRAPAPPMVLDWNEWAPIMRAYEGRKPAYFSTPPTSLVLALATGLDEILTFGLEPRFALHERVGRAMRAAWSSLGLALVPRRGELAANTLSALHLPPSVDATFVRRVLDHGVVVASGLHPELRTTTFRVGHMGYAATQPSMLRRTVAAVGAALAEGGVRVEPEAAVSALQAALDLREP